MSKNFSDILGICVFVHIVVVPLSLAREGTSSLDNGLKEKVVWPFVTREGVGRRRGNGKRNPFYISV